MSELPLEFEIEKRYVNGEIEVRKFSFVKAYSHIALYECYKKDRNNKRVHLFYECFSYSYLYSKNYKTDIY